MKTLRILIGYLLIAFSVVITLSIFSFSPSDSLFFTSRVNVPLQNMVGIPGVAIATFLILLYGQYVAYLIAFASLVIGINLLINAKAGRILMKLSLFLIAAPSLSIALAALIEGANYMDAGLIGTLIFRFFPPFFHPLVIAILFLFIVLLALSATLKIFRVITFFFAKIIGYTILLPFTLIGLFKSEPSEPLISPDMDIAEAISIEEPPNKDSLNHQTKQTENKEPDFLKTENLTTTFPFQNAQKPTPNWLTETSDQILSEIDHQYDEEVFDPVPDNQIQETNKEEITIQTPEGVPIVSETENSKESTEKESPSDFVKEELFNSENFEKDDNEKESDLDFGKTDIQQTQPRFSQADPNGFVFPDVKSLERNFDRVTHEEEQEEVAQIKKIIENTFASFKIDVQISGYSRGPTITRYELVPPSGLKLRSIVNLTDDLALKLGTRNIRIVAPIGNRSMVGVEVPNKHRRNVVLRSIIEDKSFSEKKAQLPLILGKDIAGKIIIEDLSTMPHLLIAGTTGSGKSVYVNSLISGLVFKLNHKELKFIMIDPKMVELELYNGIPHLIAPVITQPEEALATLDWTASEMDRRYKLLSEFGVRNISDFNKMIEENPGIEQANTPQSKLPYIVVVIDEFANLMLRSPKETEKVISRLAAMARAVGIHLVIATQRPSVDVVTGIIKANFPSRIAFRVSSKTDSRTILDKNGAERLLGRGDMLFMTPNSTEVCRIQSPFVSNRDVETIVNDLKQNGTADYQIDLDDIIANSSSDNSEREITVDASEDPIFGAVLKTAVENGEISASFIQRRFRVGYNRASRLVDAMDQMGILASSTGSSKPRSVLIHQEDLVHYL